MRRRDLIPFLLDRPRTLTQLARELQVPPRTLAPELEHLLRSLPHLGYEAAVTPARCRKCQFVFRADKLARPSKCPRCLGTWITEPRLAVRPRAGTNVIPAEPPPDEAGEPPTWLELLDHTADTGILVTAPDLPTLFARAAWGMFSVITDPAAVQPAEVEEIELYAEDLPALLVRWLSELNFRHVTRHRLYARFTIRTLRAPSPVGPPSSQPGAAPPPARSSPAGFLQAEARGEPIVPGRHPIYTEIKAVTFHGLEVTEIDGGWRAQIIFDL